MSASHSFNAEAGPSRLSPLIPSPKPAFAARPNAPLSTPPPTAAASTIHSQIHCDTTKPTLTAEETASIRAELFEQQKKRSPEERLRFRKSIQHFESMNALERLDCIRMAGEKVYFLSKTEAWMVENPDLNDFVSEGGFTRAAEKARISVSNYENVPLLPIGPVLYQGPDDPLPFNTNCENTEVNPADGKTYRVVAYNLPVTTFFQSSSHTNRITVYGALEEYMIPNLVMLHQHSPTSTIGGENAFVTLSSPIMAAGGTVYYSTCTNHMEVAGPRLAMHKKACKELYPQGDFIYFFEDPPLNKFGSGHSKYAGGMDRRGQYVSFVSSNNWNAVSIGTATHYARNHQEFLRSAISKESFSFRALARYSDGTGAGSIEAQNHTRELISSRQEGRIVIPNPALLDPSIRLTSSTATLANHRFFAMITRFNRDAAIKSVVETRRRNMLRSASALPALATTQEEIDFQPTAAALGSNLVHLAAVASGHVQLRSEFAERNAIDRNARKENDALISDTDAFVSSQAALYPSLGLAATMDGIAPSDSRRASSQSESKSLGFETIVRQPKRAGSDPSTAALPKRPRIDHSTGTAARSARIDHSCDCPLCGFTPEAIVPDVRIGHHLLIHACYGPMNAKTINPGRKFPMKRGFVCRICKAHFENTRGYDEHFSEDHGTRPFHCECGLSFYTFEQRDLHRTLGSLLSYARISVTDGRGRGSRRIDDSIVGARTRKTLISAIEEWKKKNDFNQDHWKNMPLSFSVSKMKLSPQNN